VTCYIPRWFTRPEAATHPSTNGKEVPPHHAWLCTLTADSYLHNFGLASTWKQAECRSHWRHLVETELCCSTWHGHDDEMLLVNVMCTSGIRISCVCTAISMMKDVSTFYASTLLEAICIRSCRRMAGSMNNVQQRYVSLAYNVLFLFSVYTVSQKNQVTLIFDITLPSVEIFSQFLKHSVQE